MFAIFEPHFIQSTFIVSQNKLEDVAFIGPTSEPWILHEHKNGIFEVDYLPAWDKSDGVNIKLNLNFLTQSSEFGFVGNIMFHVESANHFVKMRFALLNGKKQKAVNLCTVADALNPEKKFLVNGQITVHIKGVFFFKPYYETPSILSNRLWTRDDRDFALVVLDGGSKINVMVHKAVLNARSEILQNEHVVQNKFEIVDFDAKIVQTFVEYLYDQDHFDEKELQTLIGLLKFAEKYGLEHLKTKAAYFLKFEIFPDSICQIANLSIITNSSELKKMCIEIMLIYMKKEISFTGAETLVTQFLSELVQTSALGPKKLIL